ncbi:MAG: 50S ribosomal protein L18 [Candidatus Shikimatogenerans sp. JK-2022]|nr:50S ribosomal protein L18 [Candidatus Shikimatogenerans bostrichidophilus]
MKIKKKGTNEFPRISIFRSNKEIYVQIIDDINKNTILAYSSLKEKQNKKKMNKTQMSNKIGKVIAKKMLRKNIKQAFFDRKKLIYHGRIKYLIEGIRGEGIKI